MSKQQQYTIGRVFVGDRPIETLTPQEREAFRRRTVKRMGDSLNAHFSRHPEEYARIVRSHASPAPEAAVAAN